MDVNEITNEISDLDYTDKSKVYSKCFSFGRIEGGNMNDKIGLLSLLSALYIAYKKKKPDITPMDVIKAIYKGEDLTKNSAKYEFFESLSLFVEELSYDCDKSETFGLKNTKDIIKKIKELVSTWTPF